MEPVRKKNIEKCSANGSIWVKAAATVAAAILISGLTAVLPMVTSVGRLVYANNVPTVLVSMSFGPLWGAAYAAAANFVLNHTGMGSGVIPYVLIFQMAEASVIGFIWYGKSFHFGRYIFSVIAGTFLLKPVSFLLYFLFNRRYLGGKGFFEYMAGQWENYLRMGWADTLLLYASGIAAGFLLMKLIGLILKQKEKEIKKE